MLTRTVGSVVVKLFERKSAGVVGRRIKPADGGCQANGVTGQTKPKPIQHQKVIMNVRGGGGEE